MQEAKAQGWQNTLLKDDAAERWQTLL